MYANRKLHMPGGIIDAICEEWQAIAYDVLEAVRVHEGKDQMSGSDVRSVVADYVNWPRGMEYQLRQQCLQQALPERSWCI